MRVVVYTGENESRSVSYPIASFIIQLVPYSSITEQLQDVDDNIKPLFRTRHSHLSFINYGTL